MSFPESKEHEETLDSVFDRLSKPSLEEMDEIEIELEVSDDDSKNQAVTVGLAKLGDWLILKNVRINIKAVLVISIVAAILIYLIYGLPRIIGVSNIV